MSYYPFFTTDLVEQAENKQKWWPPHILDKDKHDNICMHPRSIVID